MNDLIEPLTEEEKLELGVAVGVVLENKGALEATIEALTTIKGGRLYRDSHKTFENFCEETFGFTRDWAGKLIAGEESVKELEHECNRGRLTPNNIEVLRGASANAKLELSKIPIEKRVKVVEKVLRNGTPTQRAIIEAVQVVEHRKLERVSPVLIAIDNEFQSIQHQAAYSEWPKPQRIYERLREAVSKVL